MAATAPAAAAAAANQAPGAGPAALVPRRAARHRPRRPALPAPPRARSRDRCAALLSCRSFSRLPSPRETGTAPRGHRPAGADPPPRPAGSQIAMRSAGRGEAALLPQPSPSAPAGAPDVLEETATRRGGRATSRPRPLAGAARSAAGGGAARKANAAAAAAEWGTPPPAARSTPRDPPGRGCDPRAAPGARAFLLAPLFSRLSRSTAQALLAAGTRRHPDRGRHQHLACFRTPEGSRGHAAVTQPASVKKPEEPQESGGGPDTGRRGKARAPPPSSWPPFAQGRRATPRVPRDAKWKGDHPA